MVFCVTGCSLDLGFKRLICKTTKTGHPSSEDGGKAIPAPSDPSEGPGLLCGGWGAWGGQARW